MRDPDRARSWTPGQGLRDLAWSLALRTALVALAWCGIRVLASWDGLALAFQGQSGLLLGILLGLPLGAILGFRLTDRAGFTGSLVTLAAIQGAILAGLVGTLVARGLVGAEEGEVLIALPSGAFGGAVGVIVKLTVVEA
jgi:hypothetical protein